MEIIVKDENITIKKLVQKPYDTNAYILVCAGTNNSVLIDAPSDAESILEALQGTNPQYILLTHSHMDHIGALEELRRKLQVPLAMNSADSAKIQPAPEILLNDGDTLSFGKITLKVFHTPGHTPGGLCFQYGKYLISGDTIFPGGPGATWSTDGFRQIIQSITEKIFTLPDDTLIYPGHGLHSVLKKEKEEYAVFSSRHHEQDIYGQVTWLSQ